MFNLAARFRRSWSLFNASWVVMKQNKRLLWFPCLSGISCVLILLVIFLPVAFAMFGIMMPKNTNATGSSLGISLAALIFIYYLLMFFIMTFFNSAFMFSAHLALSGEKASLKKGLKAASKRVVLIFAWSVVAATVGIILNIIERRLGWIGLIIGYILGCAWSIIAFLALPVMIFENEGPLTSMKKSISLLKKSWGEGLILNTGFNLVIAILALPFFGLAFVASSLNAPSLFIIVFTGILLLMFVSSAMRKIFEVALYHYAKTGNVYEGFSEDALKNAIRKRRLFRKKS